MLRVSRCCRHLGLRHSRTLVAHVVFESTVFRQMSGCPTSIGLGISLFRWKWQDSSRRGMRNRRAKETVEIPLGLLRTDLNFNLCSVIAWEEYISENINDHTINNCTLQAQKWKYFLLAVSVTGYNLDFWCAPVTVLANGLSVLWRMTTVHASKGTPLEGVYSFRDTEKSI